MTTQMRALLQYLAKAETTTIHRHEKETDITAMYGIYKAQNPSAKIFKRLDEIAAKIKLPLKSKDWTEQDINAINSYIEDNQLENEFTELAALFYEQYFKGAKLNEFHKDCTVAMFSMYTHSQKGAWNAVQIAINMMVSNGFINYKTIGEDGDYGTETKTGLEKCLIVCRCKVNLGLLFESYMLFGMATYYSRLIKINPEKYIENSNGWDNRLRQLMETR